ncbi:MAG: hypothetical protein ABJA10_02770 [Aestuariivirga sp.]
MTQSARALFRATGNKAKPKATRLLDGSYSKVDSIDRAEHDFTPTPPEPTRALLHYERDRLREFPLIWEAACGDGRMMRDIEATGHKTIGSDLIDRGCGAVIQDFFDFKKPLSPCIVTNPPYDKCNARDGKGAWIWHALDVLNVDYMALLLNWQWPGAGGLGNLWNVHTPARAYLMRWKVDFTGEGSPPMLNGWFIWERGHKGNCELLMMDRVDARQTRMFGVVV